MTQGDEAVAIRLPATDATWLAGIHWAEAVEVVGTGEVVGAVGRLWLVDELVGGLWRLGGVN